MNKFAAYTGYAVASTLSYVHRNFFKLAFLVVAIKVAMSISTAVEYERLIGQRFYDFTSWYHAMFDGKSIT